VQEAEEDAQKLREEKTALEGMVESNDELIMDIDKEYGLNRMGENDDDEDDDDGGDAAPPAATAVPLPAPAPPAAMPEEIVEEEAPMEMVLEQEAPEVHEFVLADVEHELPRPLFFNMIMRDY
jgi:hypothetical protein